jgi:hypothetical protein
LIVSERIECLSFESEWPAILHAGEELTKQNLTQAELGQLLGGILLVGRMVPYPPTVNAEH